MADNFFGSICLSDIPKELITTGKNGKKYLNVVVSPRRGIGLYGYTHHIKAYAKKGTVGPEVNLYIGYMKPSEYENYREQQRIAQKNTAMTPPTPQNDDGLPF